MAPKLLQSLDLFTGVAGLTLALHGIATPVAYCDIAPESHANLGANMKMGLIPKAPICPDVRKLDTKWLRENSRKKSPPDMVVAGFPCVGFSSVGLKKAFDDSQSSLFSEVLRLVDQFKLNVVFLENVAGILTLGMNTIVNELATTRGFELRWCVVSAEDVGAPQVRRRWFCLGVKPGFTFSARSLTYRPFAWTSVFPPDARMECRPFKDTQEERLRIGLLGNSVVPDAVRTAFFYLASGFSPSARLDGKSLAFVDNADKKAAVHDRLRLRYKFTARKKYRWPTAGLVVPGGETFAAPRIDATDYVKAKKVLLLKSKVRVVLDPRTFKTSKPPSKHLRHTPLKDPLTLRRWATPRYSITSASNYLTERTQRDLPTQVRFERQTPTRLKACELEARFVEWLMGYPKDWTRQHAEP
jgi:site-specific DNA-cytosine methylase